jgi:basic membrane protein A
MIKEAVVRGVIKLVAAVSVATLGLAACGSSSSGTSSGGGSTSPAKSSVKVGMAYDVGGRGDLSFNDSAGLGLDCAAGTPRSGETCPSSMPSLGVTSKELEASNGETDAQKEERLRLLAQAGYNPVIAVGFAYAPALGKVAKQFPNTHFAIVDDSSLTNTNVTSLVFNEEQSSFLVGTIAAQATKTKHVGYIGGVLTPLLQKFEAGYVAGVHAIDPSIKVDVKYLSQPPDFSGFSAPDKGKTAAQGMYDGGADVVYAAAGGSGTGAFQAAAADKKLAIGVDSDQYLTAAAGIKSVILTSALKQVDTAVYGMIKSSVGGTPLSGIQRFSLKVGGVGYAKSNPAVQPYEKVTDEWAAKITSGTEVVPTVPAK